jgi:hypothetical protein
MKAVKEARQEYYYFSPSVHLVTFKKQRVQIPSEPVIYPKVPAHACKILAFYVDYHIELQHNITMDIP